MNTFRFLILAADRPFFEGECRSAVVPTLWGQQGIMAGHSNYISAIVPGWVKFEYEDGKREKTLQCAVSEGLLKIENGDVLVLVESAEYPEQIDENRARRAAEEAKEELLQKHSVREYYEVQSQLARALNRLKAQKYKDNKF